MPPRSVIVRGNKNKTRPAGRLTESIMESTSRISGIRLPTRHSR